jgi:hypothetical protein
MGQNWKYSKLRPPEHLDMEDEGEDDPSMYDVVFMVKRPAYEFVFAVPKTQAALLRGQQALFQVRFRTQPDEQGFALNLEALEDFYESLSRLMEYVNIERLRSGDAS